MVFEFVVKSNRPLTDVKEPEKVAVAILMDMGFLKRVSSPEEAMNTVGYRLFMECFLRRPDKAWTMEEMEALLGASRPSIYNHLRRLKELDLLEGVALEGEDGGVKKGYRLRYGDISRAWGLVEAHVDMAMRNYRKNIDHLSALLKEEG
ncbi:MAG: transcriptional regulator [Thermoplasmata archaeon]|nr:transcriptional regulator [Thermoplasmata archaeon]